MRDRVRDLAYTLLATALLAVGSALACGSVESAGDAGADGDSARAESIESAARPASDSSAEKARPAKAKRSERPLPAFSGPTLDGKQLAISSLVGKRLIVWFFNPEISDAVPLAEAVRRVAALRREQNFEIVGVAVGSSRAKTAAFAKAHGLDFPVIDDSSARITRHLGLRTPFTMLGVDADGYVTWGIGQFPTDAPDAATRIEEQIRDSLRIPAADAAPPGERPLAPTFTARVLDGKEPFSLADQRGKPVILIFFLHTCPHCHEALRFLKSHLASLPEEQRPLLVGVEITGRTADVRSALRDEKLDFFPVLFDDGGKIQAEYGVFAGVPDLMLIDREGRIAGRVQGWRGPEDERLMRMRIAKLAGAPVPMLLRKDGYTGSETCGICHEREHATWEFTQHSWAYDTLVKHGAETDLECVGCHVVGFGEPGGFEISPHTAELENVGCENCHGRGGPHLSPGLVKNGDYRNACVTCHDKKHSLGFDYATFLPRISHAANARLLELPAEERRRVLAERGAMRKDLLPTQARHVGSEACRSCHPSEYETWAKGPHAHALASLESKGKANEKACLACHTTGFGRKGGFPATARASEHPDLARVGCESCHGPGGEHVPKDATKIGSIVSLGDKCDSCVILQICGACHDDANDPGFEFEVQAKIDRIRHGTIEAGTGKPLGAAQAGEDLTDAALLARAFAAARTRRTADGEASWTHP